MNSVSGTASIRMQMVAAQQRIQRLRMALDQMERDLPPQIPDLFNTLTRRVKNVRRRLVVGELSNIPDVIASLDESLKFLPASLEEDLQYHSLIDIEMESSTILNEAVSRLEMEIDESINLANRFANEEIALTLPQPFESSYQSKKVHRKQRMIAIEDRIRRHRARIHLFEDEVRSQLAPIPVLDVQTIEKMLEEEIENVSFLVSNISPIQQAPKMQQKIVHQEEVEAEPEVTKEELKSFFKEAEDKSSNLLTEARSTFAGFEDALKGIQRELIAVREKVNSIEDSFNEAKSTQEILEQEFRKLSNAQEEEHPTENHDIGNDFRTLQGQLDTLLADFQSTISNLQGKWVNDDAK